MLIPYNITLAMIIQDGKLYNLQFSTNQKMV